MYGRHVDSERPPRTRPGTMTSSTRSSVYGSGTEHCSSSSSSSSNAGLLERWYLSGAHHRHPLVFLYFRLVTTILFVKNVGKGVCRKNIHSLFMVNLTLKLL